MGERNELRKLLMDRGIKQTWLADRAGITDTALSEIVTGKRTPTLPVAKRIARVLKMRVEDIWPE
ncbi:MAG: helix-turn-helix transcriptional regulator [Coriobacteriia bacterium]